MLKTALGGTYKMAKRVVIGVIGFSVVIIGMVMLVTPGPGLVAIAGGLAILAVEFAWARSWLRKVRARISAANEQLRGNNADRHRADPD